MPSESALLPSGISRVGREGGGGVRGALIERRLEMNPKLVIDRSADQRVKAGNRGRGSLNSTLLHRSSLLLSAQCRGATEFVCFFTEFLIVVDEPSSIPGRCCWLVFFFLATRPSPVTGFYRVFQRVAPAGGAGRWRRMGPEAAAADQSPASVPVARTCSSPSAASFAYASADVRNGRCPSTPPDRAPSPAADNTIHRL